MEGLAGEIVQGSYELNTSRSTDSVHHETVRRWFILFLGGACAGWFLLRHSVRSRRLRAIMPPGPPSWPIFGSLLHILAAKQPLYLTLAKYAKSYGPVMYMHLGLLPCVVITSAEAAEVVLKDSDFSHRAVETLLATLRPLVFDCQSFFAHYDDRIKLLRKVCTTEILTTSRVATFTKARKEDIQSTLMSVARISQGGNQMVCVRDALGNQGMNMMTKMIFGRRLYGADTQVVKTLQEFGEILPEVMHLAGNINWGDMFPPLRWLDIKGFATGKLYRKRRSQMEAAFRIIVEEAKTQLAQQSDISRDDGNASANFVQVLVSKQKENNLSDTTIMGTIQDLLIGGSEAFGKTAEWALIELVRNPEKLQKLQQEIDNVTEGGSREVEESDFPNLPYLRACVREALRLYPTLPVLVPRETEKATTLNGFHLPAKTVVLVNAWQIMRDPTYYESPNNFVPERFLSSDRSSEMASDYHFLAFGGGRRGCVGLKLGTTMTQITVAALVHAYDWTPPPGLKIEDIDVTLGSSLVLGPKSPIYFRAVPRLQPGLYNIH